MLRSLEQGWAQDDAQAFIDNLPTHKGIHRAGDDVSVLAR